MSKFSRLIGQGYLPAELPPPFTSASLAAAFPSASSLGALFAAADPKKFVTKPATHSLARVGSIRRTLSIPNPVSFIFLAESIATNWHICKSIAAPRKGVLSTPIWKPASERAISWHTDFSNLSVEVIRARAGMRFTLQTDIARFYPSLYTHSLSWAVHGKERAKSKGFGSKYEFFGNELDLLSRNAQDKQTVGIPIGPDTSLVLAELVLSRLDRHLEDRGIKSHRVRYVDDIEIAFDSRIEAEQAIVYIEEFLTKFELTLNPLKTNICELPEPVEQPWVSCLRRFNFQNGAIKKSNLIDFFSTAFIESKMNRSRSVLGYALSRMDRTNLQVSNLDWPTLEGLIYQCIAVESGCIRIATKLLCKLALQGRTIDRAMLATTIASVLKHALSHAHGSEVAWAIWLAICFGIEIDLPSAEQISRTDDSVIRLIALHAHSIGLIPNLNTDRWRDDLVKDNLTGEKWLFAYEANVKNWLHPKTGGDFVGVNAVFKQLKSANVHFYDETQSLHFHAALKGNLGASNEGLFKWLAIEPSSYSLNATEAGDFESLF